MSEYRGQKINIKPLTVNQAWQGRRFKTKQYKEYEKEMLLLLGSMHIPEGPLFLMMRVGLSNKLSDIDNVAKPTIDILQKKYGFNDNRIYKLQLIKEIVKKGDEFIHIEFKEMEVSSMGAMSELHLQYEIIKWIDEAYPQYRWPICGKSNLLFTVPNEDWYGLFIELKAKGKKPTSDQIDYMDEMISNGYMASWCDNLEEARNIITDYIGQKNTHSEEGSRHDGVVTEEAIR